MKIKILVVDDEEEIRKVLSQGLLAEGYDCMTAESGYDAISIIPKFNPEVVITDYQMPNMDGIELLKFIHKQFRGTRVILLTGHAELEIAIDAVNLGAYAFFRKPLDLDDVLAAVGRIFKVVGEEFLEIRNRGEWIKEHARLSVAHSALLIATKNSGWSKR